MEQVKEYILQMPVLLFFLGWSIRLFIGWRQFSRRGVGGLQHFKYYLLGLLILFIESLFKKIGFVMMIIGCISWIYKHAWF